MSDELALSRDFERSLKSHQTRVPVDVLPTELDGEYARCTTHSPGPSSGPTLQWGALRVRVQVLPAFRKPRTY